MYECKYAYEVGVYVHAHTHAHTHMHTHMHTHSTCMTTHLQVMTGYTHVAWLIIEYCRYVCTLHTGPTNIVFTSFLKTNTEYTAHTYTNYKNDYVLNYKSWVKLDLQLQ